MGLVESLFEAAAPSQPPGPSPAHQPPVQFARHTYRPEPIEPPLRPPARPYMPKHALEHDGALRPATWQEPQPPQGSPDAAKRARFEAPALADQSAAAFLAEEARAAADRPTHDYAAADAHALACPPEEARSLAALAAHLAGPFRSDRLRARAIFRWIAGSVSYSEAYLRQRLRTGAPPAADDNTPEAVLRSRTAVCAGYAYLFEALCSRAGLAARYVSGFDGKLDHAWNAVRLEGGWALVDPTWAAGHIDLKKCSFERHFEPFWFDAPPELFVLRHAPTREADQLLENVRPARYLAEHARPEAHFYGLGMRLEAPCWRRRWAAPAGDFAFALLAPSERELKVEVARKGGAEVPGDGLASVRREEAGGGLCRHAVRVRLPEPGRYRLTIMALTESRPAGPRGGGGKPAPSGEHRLFRGVLKLKVEAGAGAGPGPHFPDSFALAGTRALERCSVGLVERQSDRARLRAPHPALRLPFVAADPAAELFLRLARAPEGWRPGDEVAWARLPEVPPGFVTMGASDLGGGRRLVAFELAFPRPGGYVAQLVARLRGEKEWQYAASYLVEAEAGTGGVPAFPLAYGGARPDVAQELGVRPASHPRPAMLEPPAGGHVALRFALARPEVRAFVRIVALEGDPLAAPPRDFGGLAPLPHGFARGGAAPGEFDVAAPPGPGCALAQLLASDPAVDGDRYRVCAAYLLRQPAGPPTAPGPLDALPPFPETAAGGDAEECRAFGVAPLQPPATRLALAPGELRARIEVASASGARLSLRLARLPDGFRPPPGHAWHEALPALPAAHAADLGSSGGRHAFELALPGPGLYLARLLAARRRADRWRCTLAYFVWAPPPPSPASARSLRALAAAGPRRPLPAFPQSFALGSADVCRGLRLRPVGPAEAAHHAARGPLALAFACARPDVELLLQVRCLTPEQAAEPLALDHAALTAAPELPPGFVRGGPSPPSPSPSEARWGFEVAFPRAPAAYAAQLLARPAGAPEWRYALGYLLEAEEGAGEAGGEPAYPETYGGASEEAARRLGVSALSHRAAAVRVGPERELRLRASVAEPSALETFLRVRREGGGPHAAEGAGLTREAGPGGYDVAFASPGRYVLQLLAGPRGESNACFVVLAYLVDVPPGADTGGEPRYPQTTGLASDEACRMCAAAPETHPDAVVPLHSARPALFAFAAAPGTAAFAQLRRLPPGGAQLPPPAALDRLSPAPDGYLRPVPSPPSRHAFELAPPGPGRFLLQLLCRPAGSPPDAPFLHVLAHVLACEGPGPAPPPPFPDSYAGASPSAAAACRVAPAPGHEAAFVRCPGPVLRLPLAAPPAPSLRLHAVPRALPPASWSWADGTPLPDAAGRVREAPPLPSGERVLELVLPRPGRYGVQVVAGPPAARTLSAVLGYAVEVERGAGEGEAGLFPLEYRQAEGLALLRPAARGLPAGSCPLFELVALDPSRAPHAAAVSSGGRWFPLPQVGPGRFAGEAGPLAAGEASVMVRWEPAGRTFRAAFALAAA